MKAHATQADPPSRPARAAAPGTKAALIPVLGLAAFASLVTLHVWINVLKVPLERPVGPIFRSGPASHEGWAPRYVAPIVALAVAAFLLDRYWRRRGRTSVAAFAAAGFAASVIAAGVALWIKNVGYTWYFVPNATPLTIIGVQPQMIALALGRGIALLVDGQRQLLVMGPAAGVVLAIAAGLPLRPEPARAWGPQSRPGGGPGQPAEVPALPRAAVMATAVLMSLAGGLVAAVGIFPAAFLVAPLVGAVWVKVSLRGGRYVLRNVLVGSAAIGALTTLPFSLALGLDVSLLVLGALARGLVFALLSTVLIKTALRLVPRPRDLAPG